MNARTLACRVDRRIESGGRAAFIVEEQRVATVESDIREAAVVASPSPVAVWCTGSVARGVDDPSTDFDVAAVFEGDDSVEEAVAGPRAVLLPTRYRRAATISVVGLSFADVQRLNQTRDPFWVELERDARAIMGSDPASTLGTIRIRERQAQPQTVSVRG